MNARKGNRIAEASFDREDQPKFRVEVDPPEDRYCRVHLWLTDGPVPLRVDGDWAAESWWHVDDDRVEGHRRTGAVPEHTFARNQRSDFYVEIPGLGYPDEPGESSEPDGVGITLNLHCVEVNARAEEDDPRTWPSWEAGERRGP